MTTSSCNKYKNVVPDITPVIYSLSMYTSTKGSYAHVYINGKNFCVNSSINSFITFGTNKIYNYTYYDSNNISFIVEKKFNYGTYDLKVVNVHDITYKYSNSVTYTITI